MKEPIRAKIDRLVPVVYGFRDALIKEIDLIDKGKQP